MQKVRNCARLISGILRVWYKAYAVLAADRAAECCRGTVTVTVVPAFEVAMTTSQQIAVFAPLFP
jgi:hypothetical protein